MSSAWPFRRASPRMCALLDYFVQTTHSGMIQLEGDTASGRACISELGRFCDGRSELNYAVPGGTIRKQAIPCRTISGRAECLIRCVTSGHPERQYRRTDRRDCALIYAGGRSRKVRGPTIRAWPMTSCWPGGSRLPSGVGGVGMNHG